MLEIFRICFLANAVQYQSGLFIVDFYSSDWVDSSIKYRKLMIILMENMKKPIKVIALNFIQVDIGLFVKLINTIYSMYAVLQSFKEWLPGCWRYFKEIFHKALMQAQQFNW